MTDDDRRDELRDEMRDELLAERLRRAMAEEAERVQPTGDGLNRIRARTAGRRTRAWWLRSPGLALGAAAVTGVVAAGVLVTSGDGDPATRDLPAAGSATSVPAAPTPSTSVPPTATTEPPATARISPKTSASGGPDGNPTAGSEPGRTMVMSVYYVGGDDSGTAAGLYQESRRMQFDVGVVRAAVQGLLGSRPADRDYANLWPPGKVLGVSLDDKRLVVDLSGSVTVRRASAEATRLGLQQLVYTATAAAKRPDALVELRVEGRPIGSLWGHPVGKLRRAKSYEVLAPVWITYPADGARVERKFRVTGEATVFEATVNWQVRQGGREFRAGFVTADLGAPERGRWQQELVLPPGSYELRAFEISAKDGSRLAGDSKQITVR